MIYHLYVFRIKKDKEVSTDEIDNNEIVDEKTYEDDDLFDVIFNKIQSTFNPSNFEYSDSVYVNYSGWKYDLDDDIIILTASSKFLVNDVELDINHDKLMELREFFHKKDVEKLDSIKNEMKKEFTGHDEKINDNDLSDVVFDLLDNSDIDNIKWDKVYNQGNGLVTNVGKYIIGVVNNTTERSKDRIYPTNNLYINDVGFKMDIHHMRKLYNFLNNKKGEIESNQKNIKRSSIRDKYIS